MNAAGLPHTTLPARCAFAARIASAIAGAYPAQQTILFGSRAFGTVHAQGGADVAVAHKGVPDHFITPKWR